ncbi:uncharacterized protein LOC121063058 [Cygnus olor]|uniref:uncharacterized protein LOC121063058 n=1 Tax=Cygnus olor TaxID=8869 RepID=UPI001ADE88EA|nr:uncharacterized protein LOC121063058 [Cygnus olor]
MHVQISQRTPISSGSHIDHAASAHPCIPLISNAGGMPYPITLHMPQISTIHSLTPHPNILPVPCMPSPGAQMPPPYFYMFLVSAFPASSYCSPTAPTYMGYGTLPSKSPNTRAPSHPPHLQRLSHPSLDALTSLTHRDNPGEVTVVAIQLMTHTRARSDLGTLVPPFFFSFASPTCFSHCRALLDAPGIPLLPHPSLTLSQPLPMLSFFTHAVFLFISFLTLSHSFFFLTISVFISGLSSFSLSQSPFPTTSMSPPSPLPREMTPFYFFHPPRNRFLLCFPTAEHSFGCTPVFWDVSSAGSSL